MNQLIQGYLTARIRKGQSDYFHLIVRQQDKRITVDGEVLEVLCDWPMVDRPTWQAPMFTKEMPAVEARRPCKRCLGRRAASARLLRGRLVGCSPK